MFHSEPLGLRLGAIWLGTDLFEVKHVNAEQKIIKEMQKNKRFPDHYAQKVDISKVSMDVMKPWIAKRITEMLGFEDDIVVDFCVAQLSEPGDKGLDPKMLQVVVTQAHEQTRAEIRTEKRKAEGRLSGQFEAGSFVSELWQHLLSAQAPNPVFRRKRTACNQGRESRNGLANKA
ncbi:Serine/arginine repetitive matrix protein 1 [Symbiodinium microadriaticum]|uniref:Serine/arginine repetitive matrix protein 1 n=1 Tax=Symbiodinium microadriaticum TaxID=2951 RepID=A0A1Q9DSJ0_SYMMI|nr:Serine/arginine repetitive matrix protein 1 [Symbiodinium microadriaticum]